MTSPRASSPRPRVLAGDSVPGADFDVAIGNVLARDSTHLFLRGGTVVRTDATAVFVRGDITVQIGPDAGVRKDGSAAALTTDAISVGQRVLAYGNVTSSNTDPVLNARAGRVRLVQTQLAGTVVNSITGQLRLDLFSIDGRNAFFFDFTDTGGSASTDADPANYQVDTGDLDLADFHPGEPARVFGFVTPFGDAPPDFEGETLVNFDDIQALLGVGWGFGGTDAPFLSMGRDGFVLDAGNPELGARHFIKVGPRIEDLTALASPLTIEPATEGRTLYAVSRPPRRVEVFRGFEDFATRVNNLLNGGSTLRTLTARGSYDEASTTLTANYVAITFTVP